MLENRVKQRLAAGEAVHGCFLRYDNATLAEFIALQGWDFLVFDAEHGALEPRDVEDLCRAAELREVTPIVRATTNLPHVILRFLDTGAHGVHVPWVNTPDEVRAAVRAVKYEPLGQRGLAGSRAGDWGMSEPLAAYVERANRETLLVVHIETAAAVGQIEEYASIDGVDVLFIGPTDLSHSLGHPGNPGHPEVRAAMDRVAEVVVPSDKTLGIFTGTPESVDEWLDRGARYFTNGVEGLLKNGMQTYLSAIRS